MAESKTLGNTSALTGTSQRRYASQHYNGVTGANIERLEEAMSEWQLWKGGNAQPQVIILFCLTTEEMKEVVRGKRTADEMLVALKGKYDAWEF
jgi:hypothetical protein